jgi:DNA replication protein DnaC
MSDQPNNPVPPLERGGELRRMQLSDYLDLKRRVVDQSPTSPVPPIDRLPARSVARTEPSCACGGTGWYSPGPTLGKADSAALLRCACKSGTDQARLTKLLRKDRGRFANATFENFETERALPDVAIWEAGRYDHATGQWVDRVCLPPEQRLMLRTVASALQRYANAPDGWIWLQGNYGSGKTHLSVAVANALAARDASTHYDSVPQLIKLLRRGIKDHTVDDRLDLLARVDLLLLDDMGMGHIGDWGDGQLEDLINERYNAERSTILTSNLPIEALSGRIGSRIAQECQVLTLVAYDYRLVLHQQRSAS